MPATSDNMAEKTNAKILPASFPPKTVRDGYKDYEFGGVGFGAMLNVGLSFLAF